MMKEAGYKADRKLINKEGAAHDVSQSISKQVPVIIGINILILNIISPNSGYWIHQIFKDV